MTEYYENSLQDRSSNIYLISFEFKLTILFWFTKFVFGFYRESSYMNKKGESRNALLFKSQIATTHTHTYIHTKYIHIHKPYVSCLSILSLYQQPPMV